MSVRLPSKKQGQFVMLASYFQKLDGGGILSVVVRTSVSTLKAHMIILSCRLDSQFLSSLSFLTLCPSSDLSFRDVGRSCLLGCLYNLTYEAGARVINAREFGAVETARRNACSSPEVAANYYSSVY